MEATTTTRKKYWTNWARYVAPLGKDPYLQDTRYDHKITALGGFTTRVRTGYYGYGSQIRAGSVSSVLAAVGTTNAMADGINPIKLHGSDKLAPRLQQMMDGWRKHDPPTNKKFPVEADVPEFIATAGRLPEATALLQAVGDLCLIAFYYLLRVGEYTQKGTRNSTKQTVQFTLEDITFFRRNEMGQLRQLPRASSDHAIITAASATLRIKNQKNGWKNVCINQEENGDGYLCPCKAVGRRYIHIRSNSTSDKDAQ